ncbi:hypothetical protein [Crenothrix sp.]|uniref:hypothetical protein n=1 Tax=Crenothrix sp. TaxID=3100433 RepID=UPI00374CC786
MHWILIGIGLIVLRLTEPMFGMFLSEISWFVFSGLFIYLGFALNNLQTAIRELQIRQRELLLELKRVSKTTRRAVQTLDYNFGHESSNAAQANTWLETDDGSQDMFFSEIADTLNEDEWEDWLADEPGEVPNIYKEAQATSSPHTTHSKTDQAFVETDESPRKNKEHDPLN